FLLALLLAVVSLTLMACGPKKLIDVDGGASHICGLRADGSPDCWSIARAHHVSDPEFDEDSPPRGETFKAISSGPLHVCALRLDGTPVCWGWERYGVTTPPEGERFVTISSGARHSCGIRKDGTAVCWGIWTDARPEHDVPAIEITEENGPRQGERYVRVSSGTGFACALRYDGTPVCWGDSRMGRTDAPIGERLIDLNSSSNHTCGLRADGTPVCWGDNSYGQSALQGDELVPGDRDKRDESIAPPSLEEKFTMISRGFKYTCGLRADGTPVCWGFNGWGQAVPPEGEKFRMIRTGQEYTCGLRADDSLVCWGVHERGLGRIMWGDLLWRMLGNP
ncbi:MAG: hypothetical protein OXI16_13475, partial [Chloroflexota bacterium]|nr:hypothetical protein [Chloroflexota bacterium]